MKTSRHFAVQVLMLAGLGLAFISRAGAGEITVPAGGNLAAAVQRATPGTTIRLVPGEYQLSPTPYTDPTCGNCPDPQRSTAATLGLKLSGKNLKIVGAGRDSTVIQTRAGYGLLIEDCTDCVVEGLTVTGGVRDPDGWATDAGILVRRSTAEIRGVRVRDLIGDSTIVDSTVVGLIGIAGREGSKFTVHDCEIIRNSWDGISLFRDSEAIIEDSLIDGVDRASGPQIGGGRGVGIVVSWNSKATIRRNLVCNYWKGIGVLLDGQAQIEQNIIEDILTWGISVWDAGHGRPMATIERNAIFRTGACGVSISDSVTAGAHPGRLAGNAIAGTCIDPRFDSGELYCKQTPIAVQAAPPDFAIEGNLLWGNRQPQHSVCEFDMPMKDFFAAVTPMLEDFHRHPVLRTSRFVIRLRDAAAQPEPGNIMKRQN